MKRFSIPELESKEKLENLYRDQKLSTRRIAGLFGVSRSVIRRRFRQFKIPRRGIAEATHIEKTNHAELNFEAISFLTGELLGDGSLYSGSRYSAKFAYSSKYREYCEWLSKTLGRFGIGLAGKIYTESDHTRNAIVFHFSSRTYAELKPIHNRFYPEGKKIIPLSLELNPLIVRQFFIGDGGLVFPSGGRRGNPCIRLATDCFTENEVDFLVEKFRNLGFLAKRGKHVKAAIITMSVRSTEKFLDYIGPCPPEIEDIYGYKWGLVRRVK